MSDIKEQIELDTQARLKTFIAELESLQDNHGFTLVARLNVQSQGIAPVIEATERKPKNPEILKP